MPQIRCSLSFHYIKVSEFDTFAIRVRDGIFNNPLVFIMPPMTLLAFQALIDTYTNARATYKAGGSAQKPAYMQARANLMAAFDTLSAYVDSVANGNDSVIILSQFVPTKGTASGVPAPTQLSGVVITHPSTGVLEVECGKQDQVTSYICIVTAGAPMPPTLNINEAGQLVIGQSIIPTPSNPSEPGRGTNPTAPFAAVIDFKPNRRKTIYGLTPGTVYYFVFIGTNANGVSQFSTPVAAVCT